MSQTTLITTKGRYTGTAAECAAWLAEMQPSSVTAERSEVSVEVEVEGTPGARVYERAIEAAFAAETTATATDDERECLLRAADDRIAALRTESAIAGDREQVALCDRALNGDEAARDECARVIAEAQREAAAE